MNNSINTRDTARPSTGSTNRSEFSFRLPKHTRRNNDNGYGERILSESNSLFLTHDRQNYGRSSPPPNMYQIHTPPIDEYLKHSLKNARKELRTKFDKMKSSNGSHFLFKQQNEQLITKTNDLKKLLHNYNINNPNTEAKKKLGYPFSSSEKLEFQKNSRIDSDRKNIPHFFKSDQDWDFGSGSRTTSMSFEHFPNLMQESIINVNSRVSSPSTNSIESRRRGLGGGQLGLGLIKKSPISLSRKH